ncbi:MAG: diol dehydratase small subunit [Desulfobacterales bacterium]|nr:diol dehydratase small subunit [Desulfobacterales bacterium]
MAQSKETPISEDLIAKAVKQAIAALEQRATAGAVQGPPGKGLDAGKDYPLASQRSELVKSASGLAFDDIRLDKVLSGQIGFDDIKIRPETLEYQAQIADSIGRPRLASNLRRAAEMTRIPDKRVLEMYDNLRPYRCTKQELLDIATELESTYQAKICAALFREAAEIYEKRGRLKQA